MPPKRDKRKPGASSGNGASTTAAGRRTTRGHNTSAAGGNGGASAQSKRVTTPKPEGGSGRNTNNSRGKRSRAAASRASATPTVKRAANKRVGPRGKKEKELTSFKGENGEVYKIGDFAYVDSQQPDLPHHICVIRDFKLDRKDTVIAEVKWFYRVSELPESVYHLLMQDRETGKDAELFKHPQMRERELFMAFNIDTHSASLFRGKCKVKQLSDLADVSSFLTEDNSFLYVFGYKPESRRLTLTDEDIYIPQSQQAELPECHLASPSSSSSPRPLSPSERYTRPESRITNHEQLVWKPHQLPDEQLLMFLRAARSIALHAGVCMNGLITDGYLAASADETTQQAFNVLHRNDHSTEKALQELVKRPTVGQLVAKRNWNKESTVLFAKGIRQFGKNFFKMQKELLPKKKIRELAEYYYYWKKTHPGLSSRNTRRQRKQTHIRLCRMMMKPHEVTPEREYMDWSSCDEDDAVEEDGEKGQSVYVCRQCYSTTSPNWHHAGQQKAILCESCRISFKKYGHMKPVEATAEPPNILYKSHYESLSNDDATTTSGSRRKTRNSNGSRGMTTRPGLRSQKIVQKNDSEEEDDITDSGSEGSMEDERVRSLPQPKQKALQTRRSMLDHLDDSIKTTPTNVPESGEQTPATKRVKNEEEGNESDEEESTGSTNGEGSQGSTPSTQKSPAGGAKSSANSSLISQSGGDKNESTSSAVMLKETPQTDSGTTLLNLPQNFSRACKDTDSTCARTDLVYVHPPPEEKPPSVPKLHPQVVQRLTGGPLPPPSHPTLSSSHKVPIITNYAPQLPMGPGPILQFPFTYPALASTAGPPNVPATVSSHNNPLPRHPDAVEAAAAMRDVKRIPPREEGFAYHTAMRHQQQQQQQQALQKMEMAQATHAHAHPHAQLPTSHPVKGTPAPPISRAPHSMDHHGQSGPQQKQPHTQQQQQQPLMFTFPSPDEMALHQQRVMALVQSGIPVSEPFPGGAAIFQPGLYPAHLYPGNQLTLEEQQAILAAQQMQQAQAQAQAQAQGQVPQFIPGAVPTALLEQLVAQQQHQQQQQQQAALANAVVAAATAGGLANVVPATPGDSILEVQRQYEGLMLAVQNNPIYAQNPNVHLALEHYKRILQEHHMQQQQRLHEVIMQNTQQHELHKHLLLARPPGAPAEEGSSSRGIRTGVIVHPN